MSRLCAKPLCLIFLACLLPACAVQPASAPPANKTLTWSERSQINRCISTWQIKGAIAINVPKEHFSSSLNWDQMGENKYNVTLVGPIGSGSMMLNRENDEVSLQTSSGHRAVANNAETLMKQELAWSLPISNMFYWVRALPAPTLPSTPTLDAYNHLVTLTQEGWTIDYLKYTSVDGIDLPSKIFMNHADVHVRLIINQWQIEKNCPS